MTSAERHELEIARKLLVEWEQNATEAAKKEFKRKLRVDPSDPSNKLNADIQVTDIQLTPSPTSLLGRTRTFLGKVNEQETEG